MAKINRRYIDKHWIVFLLRGALAAVFGGLLLFGGLERPDAVIAMMAVCLLLMGIVDAMGALYSSAKKHGWINAVLDALVDVAAAVVLLFFANGDLLTTVVILSVYTIVSGVIDIFHGFLPTVDPTDRFIRVLVGIFGCVIGAVILNSGGFEKMTFVRFFGVYMLIVGATSLIYGVHNRAQNIEDKVARRQDHQKAKKSSKRKK